MRTTAFSLVLVATVVVALLSSPASAVLAAAMATPAAPTSPQGADPLTLLSGLAPFLTVIILAGTLILQTVQYRGAERDRRADNEQKAWDKAVKAASGPDKLAASIRLRAFLKTKYAQEARELAYQVLLQNQDPDLFQNLFTSAFEPLTWDVTLPLVLQLNRAIRTRVDPLETKYYKGKEKGEELTPAEQEQQSYGESAIRYICGELAPLLRRPRPPGAKLDLSYCAAWNCDWSNANLDAADVTGFFPVRVKWRGADLAVGAFDSWEDWSQGNAWWQAARISPALLTYLKEKAPYRPTQDYPVPTSQQDYDDAIARLAQHGSAAP